MSETFEVAKLGSNSSTVKVLSVEQMEGGLNIRDVLKTPISVLRPLSQLRIQRTSRGAPNDVYD